MADRLTQLQDCLDDLATQMFASIRYIQTHHSSTAIPGQPDMSQEPTTQPGQATQTTTPNPDAPQEPTTGPDPPDVFKSALRELARDLVLKEQQIEYLISVLPGIGESEDNQNQRIKVLEQELRDADAERKEALDKREHMLDTLSKLAAECKRVY